ncbi:TPR end-of-group domain-containing protein [Anabaena sp. CCY 9910]|uniref:TPR end-of-group domain-containing protein n=1 Tax=Anabaena sp. CCY 9910 TaxID=3103870 RepID=UPI0039E07C87
MKRWHLFKTTFMVMVGILLLTSSKTVAQPPCETDKILFSKKFYGDTQPIYGALFQKDSNLICAKDGIKEIINAQEKTTLVITRDRAYEESEQLKDSHNEYVEAMKPDPIASKVRKAPKECLKASENPIVVDEFSAVRELAYVGLYKEAGEELKKIIKQKPNLKVPEDLKCLLKHSFDWQWVRLWNQLIVPSITETAEALIPILVILLALWVLYRQIKSLPRLRLDIQSFDDGVTELKIGKGLAAMVEESLKNTDTFGSRVRMDFVGGPAEGVNLPIDFKQGGELFKLITQVIKLAFPQRVLTLSGHLLAAGESGVGLTLVLKSQTGKIVAYSTIWQKSYDLVLAKKVEPTKNNATPYYILAEPAAIWTLFQLDNFYPCLKIRDWLAVKDWESYAYFRFGVYWLSSEDNEKNKKARQMFINALQPERDSSNQFALLNLAILNLKEEVKTEKPNYEGVIEMLNRAIKSSKVPKCNSDSYIKDIVWYKANYQLAAIYLYIDDKKDDEKLEWISKNLEKEINKALNLQVESQCCVQKSQQSDSKESMDMDRWQKLLTINKNEDKVQQVLKLIYPLIFIMNEEILYRKSLHINQDLENGLAEASVKAEAKKRINLIEDEKIKLKLSYRARYNLACFYTSLGDYEKALGHLKYALEFSIGNSLKDWAKKDPSLEKLRKEKKDEFDKTIRIYTQATENLTTLGAEVIKQ